MRSQDIARYIYKHPGRCIAMTLVLTVVIGAGLYNFTLTMDMDDMLPETDEVRYLQAVQAEFFDMEMAAIVTKGEPVLSPTYFHEVADIVTAWTDDEDIIGILLADPTISIMTIPTILAQYDLMSEGNLQPTMEEILTRVRTYDSLEAIRTLALAYVGDENIPKLYRNAFWVMLPEDTPPSLDPVPKLGALDRCKSFARKADRVFGRDRGPSGGNHACIRPSQDRQ